MATGEAELIKAVRGLGQGGIDGIPDSLAELWRIMLEYRGGSSFAAEKMLLRMLFKNMNGPSAERVRRYPMTWSVLGVVFSRISTFSLAQSLVDINFMSALAQTLKELSEPQAKSESKPLGKRKRTDTASFDLETQRESAGCLQTAETLFQALQTLISRCDYSSSSGIHGKMGSEHIKALFYATEWREHREMLLGLLALCNLSIGSDETYEGQPSWTSTFVSIWNLHMRNEAESLDVAQYLSASCTLIIKKLTKPSGSEALASHQKIRDRWIQDLRRFLTRHLVLPIRTLSVSNGQASMITVTMHMRHQPSTFPVLFDLVLNAPSAIGSLTAKRDHEIWVQEVFEVIEKALREGKSKRKNVILQEMLEKAQEKGAALSLQTLRLICEEYALQPDRVAWDILQCLVELDPDVFLVPQKTRDLLDDALQATRDTADLSEADFAKMSGFVVSLAKGFAVARNFSGFLRKWHENLAHLNFHQRSDAPRNVWCTQELSTTVSRMLQTSLNTKQLQDVIDWLESQSTPAQKTASILILGALSEGTSQDDFVDVLSTRPFALAFSREDEEPQSPDVCTARWTVAARTFSWGTLKEREDIWPRIAKQIGQVLKKAPLDSEDTLAAFKCSAAAWVGHYPDGEYEEAAATTVCSLVKRLTSKKRAPTAEQLVKYSAWIAQESRLLSLIESRDSKLFKALLERAGSGRDVERDVHRQTICLETYDLILTNEVNINNLKLMNELVEQMVNMLEQNDWSSALMEVAVTSLLAIPVVYFNSDMRQKIVRHLLRHSQASQNAGIECIKRNLSLLVRVMEKPVLYEGLEFRDLDVIARSIVTVVKGETWAHDDLLGAQEALRLLEELTSLILQRVTSNVMTRELDYLSTAVQFVAANPEEDGLFRVPRLLHLKSLVAKLSPTTSKTLDMSNTSRQLIDAIALHIRGFLDAWTQKRKDWDSKALLCLLTALQAAEPVDVEVLRASLRASVSDLMTASNELVGHGLRAGWEIKIFLAKYFDEMFRSPLDLIHVEAVDSSDLTEDRTASPPKVDRDTIVQFFDVAIRNIDEDAKVGYLEQLLALELTGDWTYQLLVIYLLIHRIKDTRPSGDGFDLATAHTVLSKKMHETTRTDEFILVAQTLHMLFAQKPTSIDQWNIELTLSDISIVCSTMDSRQLASPQVYQWLCRLAQVLVARYRKRLQGRSHLVVTVLQSLLKCLVTHPAFWDKCARSYTRLITQICEPTATSANRGNTNRAALESERDEIKRYAGQHMYMVLMQYIKLLVEHHVPQEVREALEPGVHAILDVTTKDGLRIMNDALDSSGRVVMKDIYKRYEKFGKWTGV